MNPANALIEPTIVRTYKFRAYPTDVQVDALEKQLGEACDLYNAAIEHRKIMWREHRKSVSLYEQKREITHMRKEGLLDKEANTWAQQETLWRVDRAFRGFYRRVKAGQTPGYPRYRSRNRYDSLTWDYREKCNGCKIRPNGRLYLQAVGEVRIRWHRPIPADAKIKQLSIKRNSGKRWYVCFVLELPQPTPLPATRNCIGIDLGVTTFAALSDGQQIEGPRALKKALADINAAQRRVSRRQYGSHRRRKAIQVLARKYERTANVRKDHAHKTARTLVGRFDLLAFEDLNYRSMLQHGMKSLAREVKDQAWANFIQILCDKAEWAGREVVEVDARGTSQECSACHTIVSKTLKQRQHKCACGLTLDRDINAARNILQRGLGQSLQGQLEPEKSSIATRPSRI